MDQKIIPEWQMVSLDGTDIVIKSRIVKRELLQYLAEVLVDGADGIYRNRSGFEINEYVIMPENATDADGNVLNPKVGEQIDIAKDMQPQLFRYEKDTKKLSPVTGDNYKIIIYSRDR